MTNSQDQIATLESIENIPAPSKTVIQSMGKSNWFYSFRTSETTTYNGISKQKPFKDPQEGDFVKYLP